jgi:hypothetical protein
MLERVKMIVHSMYDWSGGAQQIAEKARNLLEDANFARLNAHDVSSNRDCTTLNYRMNQLLTLLFPQNRSTLFTNRAIIQCFSECFFGGDTRHTSYGCAPDTAEFFTKCTASMMAWICTLIHWVIKIKESGLPRGARFEYSSVSCQFCFLVPTWFNANKLSNLSPFLE